MSKNKKDTLETWIEERKVTPVTAEFMRKNKHLLDELKETARRDRSSTLQPKVSVVSPSMYKMLMEQ